MVDLKIDRRDGAVIVTGAAIILASGMVGYMLAGAASLIVPVTFAAVLVLFVSFEIYRRLSEEMIYLQRAQVDQQSQHYRQIEALFSLFSTLKPSLTFPEMRGSAASPDILRKISEVVLTEKPNLVVEASSGVSTLVIAYCLRQLGKGRVVSLEHDAKYAELTQQFIALHGLDDVATVVHAPLQGYEIGGATWQWYATDALPTDETIDLYVIDGPPENLQQQARYPAMPLLYERLSRRATIILDDGRREDEKAIVARWRQEFSDFTTDFVACEKGAYVMRRTDAAGGDT